MLRTDQIYFTDNIRCFAKELVDEWMSSNDTLTLEKGHDINGLKNFDKYVYLIRRGSVRTYHIHEDGKECIVGLLAFGDFINLFDSFTPKSSSMFFTAQTEVELVAISKVEIREILEGDPSLALKLLGHASTRIQEMVEILSQVAYGKVEERLFYLFRKLSDPVLSDGGWRPVPHAVTHQDLAGMVGSTRETVTLVLNKMIQSGRLMHRDDMLWILGEENEENLSV